MTNSFVDAGARSRSFHLGPILFAAADAVTLGGYINAHVYTVALGRFRAQVRIGRRPFRRTS